jgi:hypothetical protein
MKRILNCDHADRSLRACGSSRKRLGFFVQLPREATSVPKQFIQELGSLGTVM